MRPLPLRRPPKTHDSERGWDEGKRKEAEWRDGDVFPVGFLNYRVYLWLTYYYYVVA